MHKSGKTPEKKKWFPGSSPCKLQGWVEDFHDRVSPHLKLSIASVTLSKIMYNETHFTIG